MTKFIQKSIWKGFRGWIGGFKAAVIKYLPLSKEKIMWTWINKNKEKEEGSRTVLETELIGLSGHLCDTVSLIQQHGRRVRWWIDMLRWRFLWTWESTGDVRFSSVQLLSCVWFFATPWSAACQASLSITNSQSSLKLMSIELVMPSNHLILCHPFLLLSSIFPSIRVFSKESSLRIRWPKYWHFSISPSSEYSGLITFRMD